MKKLLFSAVSLLTAISICSCGGKTSSDESSAGQTLSEPAAAKTDDSLFSEYVSNTYIATGNNNLIESADHVTYRAYFPLEEYGELEYCFYFSNTVDSTYDDGSKAHVGLAGGAYTIESAFIADGGTSIEDEITSRTPVTFGSDETKSVKSSETFWSDPVTFDIEEGHFLVWEWTLTGENIPANSMSNLTKIGADYNDGKGLVYCGEAPLPLLIGAKRDVKYRIAAIGDSITQGCQTQFMEYEFWAARIAQQLGEGYGFWNCGLGWSRTSDAASCGDWLERTSSADVVIVAFGTNDIISGEYGGDGGNTASEINTYLREILTVLKAKNCNVIVFNAPPEDYREDLESVRTEYNELIKETCDEFGVFLFDFASYLSDESNPAKALYGAHPNGEGGQIVADAFMETYADFLDIK